MGRAKRRAGAVRTVTTQFISHFLLLAVMLAFPAWKSRRNSSVIPPRGPGRGQGSQLGSRPWALGMLENKYIPFRKCGRERFDIIDSVHKRCSPAWKGQCVTMQFQYSGYPNSFFFLLFFPLAVKTGKVLQMKVSS